jgi:hypothetical protein
MVMVVTPSPDSEFFRAGEYADFDTLNAMTDDISARSPVTSENVVG